MKPPPPAAGAADILVVDDTPANLHLLGSMLGKFGYSIRPASTGSLALRAAQRQPPDLILLDVMMPEMDGYEVCLQLKADARLKDIPVIFISALGGVDDKVKAFQFGGVDYITKPFHAEEVRVRVSTHLEMRRQQLAAGRKSDALALLVNLRTRQLAETNEKFAALDQGQSQLTAQRGQLDSAKQQFLRFIAHELRTPLNGLLGAADLALAELVSGPPTAEIKKLFEESRQRLLLFMEDALLLSHAEAEGGPVAVSPLDAVLATAVQECRDTAAVNDLRLGPPPQGLGRVRGDAYFLTRAILRLLETGIKFCSPGGELTLAATPLAHEVVLVIRASGHTVPERFLPGFFAPMANGGAVTPRGDLGLSPAVASQIILRVGGAVAIQNTVPGGVEIVARLPRGTGEMPPAAG